MAKGDFIWSDVSTFGLAGAKPFYAGLFGWSYQHLTQPDGSDYAVASTPSGEAAGLFEMPEKFRKIGLPSFWMPYFAVDDVEAACAIAERYGGKIEVRPLAWSDTDQIALIRDPLGAGFTVHQGTGLPADSAAGRHGHRIGCGLYISDVEAVRAFYEALFDWRITAQRDRPGDHAARNAQGTMVATVHEIDETRRGKYQFWGIHFGVDNPARAIAHIERNGGTIVEQDRSSGELTILAKDPDGAAFFLNPGAGNTDQPAAHRGGGGLAARWKTALALVSLYVAVLFEQNWVWGVLFILWTLPALRTGDTFFVETVTRRANPVLFWLIVATWIGLSLYLIVSDLFRLAGASG